MNNIDKKLVAVMFGGVSVEHEVSVISGIQVLEALEVAGFETIAVYLDKKGVWWTGDVLKDIFAYKKAGFDSAKFKNIDRVGFSGDEWGFVGGSGAGWGKVGANIKGLVFKKHLKKPDIFFPVFHGGDGENGSMQGLFEVYNVPFVGSSVVASAVLMDKYVQKKLFESIGVPVLPSLLISKKDFTLDAKKVLTSIQNFETYPLIVKPNDLGSTIGVARVDNEGELVSALGVVFKFSEYALIERCLVGHIELNCAVMAEGGKVSVLEQPVASGNVLTYEDKYLRGGKGGKLASSGMASLERVFPAKVSDEVRSKVQKYALECCTLLRTSGSVRADFFYIQATNEIYLCEINTIPGSLAFYLWEASGVRFDQLVTILVEEGFARYESRQKLLKSFESKLLK